MTVKSFMILITGTVIVGISFLNILVLVTTGNKTDIWLIIMALGMILVAMSNILSEIESQTPIFKNIEGLMKEKQKKENKKTGEE